MKITNRSSQTEIFVTGEGDNYYERNKSAFGNEEQRHAEKLLCEALSSFRAEIKGVLEIGCSSGMKLEYLCKYFGASGKGIDPSSKAVRDGNERLSRSGATNLALQVGTADSLPYKDGEFDLVYFAFCLYLVDRDKLFAAIAEADRVLKPGGFLAIVDFDPAQRHKRSYHHRENVFSYKQPYADLFVASGHYYLVAKSSFSHSGHYFAKDSDERVSLGLLYKEPDAYWVKGSE
ncbi:MAG: class I SAM-dependent methyltransferase [Terriglobales bacterium]|jgi:ubiquinone/menaquinone biosynthesis C-methylase UbiE